MNNLKRIKLRTPKFAILAFLFSFSLLTTPKARAAAPNDVVIITDALDDDIRAIVHMLLDPGSRNRVKAIVCSTGNVQLKTAIIRKIVKGLGLNIPVYAGTATNLRNNSVTEFAGFLEKEGGPLLTPQERAYYSSISEKSGDGAEQLNQLIAEQAASGKVLDTLLLTAPIDLVPAMQKNPRDSQKVLGDLFTMGIWKNIGSDTDAKFVSPYNTMADPESSLSLIRMVNGGFFKRAFHAPSDTIQKRTGLEGGYIPETVEGKALRQRLKDAMNQHPVLKDVFGAAQEYGLSWIHTATQRVGMGLNAHDRWVPSSFKDPEAAAGFYLADMTPTVMSMMNDSELANLKFTPRFMTGTGNINTSRPVLESFTLFENKQSNGQGGFLDLVELDGPAVLEKHLEAVESAPRKFPAVASYRDAIPEALSFRVEETKAIVSHGKKKNLVIIFKNSPDDWFGLLRILGTEKGRQALLNGGIIAEGFNTHEMALNIKAVLNDLGVASIPVAAGHNYTQEEIAKVPNLALEAALQNNNFSSEAFKDLPRLSEQSDDGKILTPDQLIGRSAVWAEKNNTQFDAIVLGEGIDLINHVNSDAESRKRLGSLFVMGGGRMAQKDGVNQFSFTRNWLPHEAVVVPGLNQLGKEGKNIWTFSSDEFGGSLVAATEENVGNAETAFNRLKELSRIPGINSISKHWENWSKNVAWFFKDKKEGLPFDPQKPVAKVTISPLGLVIADEYVKGELENGSSPIQYDAIDLEETRATKTVSIAQESTGIKWLRGAGHNNVVALASRFSDTLNEVEQTRVAAIHNDGVRDRGLFGGEGDRFFASDASKLGKTDCKSKLQ